MKIQEGPAFGAFIIGFGLGYLMLHAGKPLWMAMGAGTLAAVVDYVVLVFLKSKKIGK
ncbi:MAG: hypothetical protein ABJG88_11400 [Litorimonas sp.]